MTGIDPKPYQGLEPRDGQKRHHPDDVAELVLRVAAKLQGDGRSYFTIRDLQAVAGISSSCTASLYLRRLAKQGLTHKGNGLRGHWSVTKEGLAKVNPPGPKVKLSEAPERLAQSLCSSLRATVWKHVAISELLPCPAARVDDFADKLIALVTAFTLESTEKEA